MLRLEKHPRRTELSYWPLPEAKAAPQMFVLVPDTEADLALLTRKVRELARDGAFHVRFIGLCREPDQGLAVRRALAALSSLLNPGQGTSSVEVCTDRNWVEGLRARLKPGDVVLFWDARTAQRAYNPLRQLLQAKLAVPLYIVPAQPAPQSARLPWDRQAAAWIGALAILAGFTWLQIRIYQQPGSLTTLLGLMSTLLEFGLLWAWHNWVR